MSLSTAVRILYVLSHSCVSRKWIKDPVTGKQKRQCLCELPCTDSPIRTNGIRKRPYNILIMEEVQTIVALGAGGDYKKSVSRRANRAVRECEGCGSLYRKN